MSFEGNVAVLCIKKSQTSDSGTYTCSASNEAGAASYSVEISITGTDMCFTHCVDPLHLYQGFVLFAWFVVLNTFTL